MFAQPFWVLLWRQKYLASAGTASGETGLKLNSPPTEAGDYSSLLSRWRDAFDFLIP
jgi:hypothetical protein